MNALLQIALNPDKIGAEVRKCFLLHNIYMQLPYGLKALCKFVGDESSSFSSP